MLKFLYRSCIITILSCALITQSFAQSAPPPAAVPQSNSNNVMTQQAQQALLATQMYAMAAADKKAKDACAQSSSSQECMSATVAAARAHAETSAMQNRFGANSGSGSTSGTTTTNEGVVIDNKTGVQTVTKMANVEGHKTETNMLNSITMAIVGLIAARLYKYKMTTDVMLAAAGGAAFLIGEFSSSKDVNKFTKELTYRSDGKVDNEQMAALEKMKTDLEAARDAVKKKKQFQSIAMYAFAAATLAALFLKSSLLFAQESCLTTTTTLSTTCSATICPAPLQSAVAGPAEATAAQRAQMAASAEAAMMASSLQNTTLTKDQLQGAVLSETAATAVTTSATTCSVAAAATCTSTLGTGCAAVGTAATGIAACAAAYAAKEAACAAEDATWKMSTSFGIPFNFVYSPPSYPKLFTPNVVVENKLNPNFFEKLINFFIPRAQAGQAELLFGVGGIGVGMALSATLGTYVDTWLFTPMKRAFIWGVLGFLSKTAADSSQKIIDDLEGQISKVNAIIASMKGNAGGTPADKAVVPVTATMPLFAVSGGGFDAITSDGSNIPCVTTGATSNCPSVTKAMSSTPDWKALPADVQGLAMGVGNFMNKVQGKPGISSDAMGAGVALNGSASGLNKMLGNARAKVNSQLKKMGKPTIDFNKAENDLLKQMNQATADGLQKAGLSASGMLASMGRGGGGGDGAVKKPEAPTFAKSKGTPAVGGGASAAPKAPTFNFKEDKPALEVGAEGAGGKGDVYEMSAKSDISADAGGSIFNLISERYFKSAYPKLLEETPAAAPASAPAPAPVKK